MRLTFSVLLIAFFASLVSAQISPGNPLDGLEKLRDYESMRSSSSDPNWQNGNGDARPIAPGETLTLGELDGPGIIQHIWFTIAHDATGYSRLLTLRMYWDGEEHPSVESPVGDFFVIGHGVDKPFWSIPVRVTSEGRARNCYWPMPFGRSARITVTNDSDVPCGAFFWYIDWKKLPDLPKDTAYFHAMYRQEFPCVMGRNYLLADIRGRGHYVGTVQSVYHVSPGWYGEGDDFWFIDGEKEPRLRGTGTEDYFCNAWGFNQFDGPYYGVPLWEGFDTGDRGTAYRWHIADPVAFKRSLRVEIEHKGSQSFPDGSGSGFIERDDLMSSVAFWYQIEPHKRWPAMPPGPDRLPFRDRVVVEGEAQLDVAVHGDIVTSVQDIGGASGGKQLFFNPTQDGAVLEVPFETAEDVSGQLTVKMVHSWDYGRYAVKLDGEEVGVWDLWADNVVPTDYSLGLRTLKAGKHVLRFECRGHNASSKGYFLGFDALVAREPVYFRPPDKDLRELQVERKG